jgi:hypothetical protein
MTYREVEKLTSSVSMHIQSPQSARVMLDIVTSQLLRPPVMRRRGSPLHTWLGTFSCNIQHIFYQDVLMCFYPQSSHYCTHLIPLLPSPFTSDHKINNKRNGKKIKIFINFVNFVAFFRLFSKKNRKAQIYSLHCYPFSSQLVLNLTHALSWVQRGH